MTKIRDSDMPEENYWNSFFDAEKILRELDFSNTVNDVADLGCGFGTFTFVAAKIAQGIVYALDIEEDMIELIRLKSKEQGYTNIVPIQADFMKNGTGLDDESMDYVFLFNILHTKNPQKLLDEASRILVEDGKLAIIHWNYDSTTPRGPSLDMRPQPEEIVNWALQTNFSLIKQVDLKPYHYGLLFS